MSPLARALAAAGAAAFLLLTGIAAFNQPVEYDEAYNATVAKALAEGLGYATTFHLTIPFNPEITTGPTVLLPMAALVWLAGPQPWAPGLATWMACAAVLPLLCLGLARRLEAQGARPAAAGLAAWPFLLLVWLFGAIGFASVGVGEMPATLLLALGAVWLSDALAGPRRRAALAGGLAMGLGVLTKLIIALPAAGVLGALALAVARRHGARAALGFLAMAAGATALPVLAFLLVRAGSFDPAAELQFMNRAGAGLGALSLPELGLRLQATARLHGGILLHWAGGAAGLALGIALPAAVALLALSRRAPPVAVALAGLAAGAAALLAWWVPLGGSALLRHALPALLCLLLVLSVAPVALPWPAARAAALGALAACALLLGWTREERLAGLPPGFGQRSALGEDTVAVTSRLHLAPHPRLAEQREAAAALARLRAAEPGLPVVSAGWWAPRELEYLLPGSGILRDRWRPPTDRGPALLVISEAYWNWLGEPLPEALRAACGEVAWRNRSYAIQRCP